MFLFFLTMVSQSFVSLPVPIVGWSTWIDSGSWRGPQCLSPVFDIRNQVFLLATAASTTIQGTLKDSLQRGVVPGHMTKRRPASVASWGPWCPAIVETVLCRWLNVLWMRSKEASSGTCFRILWFSSLCRRAESTFHRAGSQLQEICTGFTL